MSIGLVVGVGGIGSEVARLTRKSVNQLVLFDRDAARVKGLALQLGCIGVVGDITSATGRDELVENVCQLSGTLQWVVLTSGRGLRGAITEVTVDALRSVFDTNVVAPMVLVQELLKRAAWAQESRLVGIGSTSARRALPGRTVYGASKAAFETFLLNLGVEVATRGILVNVLVAGATDTPFIGAVRDDLAQWATKRVPSQRMGRTMEVASVIAYLVTSAPSYLTCSRVVVDGGTEAMP